MIKYTQKYILGPGIHGPKPDQDRKFKISDWSNKIMKITDQLGPISPRNLNLHPNNTMMVKRRIHEPEQNSFPL